MERVYINPVMTKYGMDEDWTAEPRFDDEGFCVNWSGAGAAVFRFPSMEDAQSEENTNDSRSLRAQA